VGVSVDYVKTSFFYNLQLREIFIFLNSGFAKNFKENFRLFNLFPTPREPFLLRRAYSSISEKRKDIM